MKRKTVKYIERFNYMECGMLWYRDLSSLHPSIAMNPEHCLVQRNPIVHPCLSMTSEQVTVVPNNRAMGRKFKLGRKFEERNYFVFQANNFTFESTVGLFKDQSLTAWKISISDA